MRIALSAAFLDFLLSRKTAPLAQKLRVRLLLAISILHEMAHAMWILRAESEGLGFREGSEWKGEGGLSGGREPLHGPGEPEAELGWSWETAMFGGRIQSVGFEVGCQEGLVRVGWEGGREMLRGIEEGRGGFWGVGMGWVGRVCAGGGWGGNGEGEEGGMLVGEGVRVPFSKEGWARRWGG